MNRVPVVGLAGYSGSGKTTFLEKLIAELKGRGRRVGLVKHTHHQVEFDQPGKDTWRHARAGAEVVALAAPTGVALFKKFAEPPGAEDVFPLLGEVDLIIVEGYKKGWWPKIEIYHRGVAERPALPEEELLAVVSDAGPCCGAPWYAPDDAAGVADLIELRIMKLKGN